MTGVSENQLYYGDNLDILRKYVKDESVDLIYLDPPFNSNRAYNVIFSRGQVDENAAQIQAFDDTWHWTSTTESQYSSLVQLAPGRLADAMSAFRVLLGENDAMAYLVNMAPRILELHRVLKNDGSLYLHCDPTMSHYLKVLLDAVFGATRFQNEIIWCYEIGGRSKKRWARKHDVILFYSRSDRFNFDWTVVKTPRKAGTHMRTGVSADGRPYQEKTDRKTGRVYRYYLDEGAIPPDFWIGIQQLNREAAERIGYPTQKPRALLERIIAASSPEGGLILDPFCGCGTSIDAAQRLNRRWIGIDIAYIAIDVITNRLIHIFGDQIESTYEVNGIPSDVASAHALFERSPFEFERWAVSLLNAEPNAKQVGDKGVDGIARFLVDDKGNLGKMLVSVKGGKTVTPAFVRDLDGAINAQRAAMGVLITQVPASRGVQEAINHGGTYMHSLSRQSFPRLQHITIADLLAGKYPQMPTIKLPYFPDSQQSVTVPVPRSSNRTGSTVPSLLLDSKYIDR